jgi:hypothetical protein
MNRREIKNRREGMPTEALLTNAQPLDQASVSLVIILSEIVEKPSPLSDEL